MTTTDTEDRTAAHLVDGLRALATFVDANPHLTREIAYQLRHLIVPIGNNEDPRARMAEFAHAATSATKDYDDTWAGLTIQFSPNVALWFYAQRDQICERVVTGTREVIKEVPDPKALAAVPTVTVTETEDVVEWLCSPLLADRVRDNEATDATRDAYLELASDGAL